MLEKILKLPFEEILRLLSNLKTEITDADLLMETVYKIRIPDEQIELFKADFNN